MKSIVSTVVIASALIAGAAQAASRSSASAYGLTADGRLLQFKVARNIRPGTIGFLSGFSNGETSLIGMDFRVQNGQLYGVGNAGGIYTIDTATASMTLVGVLTTAPSGTQFGVDFNPAANRLRVVSDTGQNLRHDVGTMGFTTLVDTALTTPTTGIGGAAYINNDVSSVTGTALYDLDVTNNQIHLQSPANNGTLALIGGLGVDPAGAVGFDIQTAANEAGIAVRNTGYAAMTLNGEAMTRVFEIDLTTGAALLAGSFPDGLSVVDIAFPTPAVVID